MSGKPGGLFLFFPLSAGSHSCHKVSSYAEFFFFFFGCEPYAIFGRLFVVT